jgi:hypothetical protein
MKRTPAFSKVRTEEKAVKLIQKFSEFTFSNFNEYKTTMASVALVTKDATKAEKFSCTCVTNAKEFKCIHSLGVAIKVGAYVVRTSLKDVRLGRKRKRGNTANSKGALVYSNFNLTSPDRHPNRQNDAQLVEGFPNAVLENNDINDVLENNDVM